MFLYRHADRIVTVTRGLRKTLIGRGVDGGKIVTVTNGVDMVRFRPTRKDDALLRQLGLEGKFVCGYVGTHGLAHHLETILDAAERLAADGLGDRFHFILLGDGARKQALRAEAQRRGLANVTFVDTVPKADVARYWSVLDVSIIHLRQTELFTTAIPSKLFECMGMGLPVLHGVAGESAGIVRSEGVGVVFEPENSEQLVAEIRSLAQDPVRYASYRSNCLATAKKYDRAALASSMLGVLHGALAVRR